MEPPLLGKYVSPKSQTPSRRYPWFRRFLMFLMAVGFGVLLIGPMMQVHYQGIGDKPISFELSDAWQRASYVLMPIGASIVVLAGIVLAVIDRKPRPEG